MFERFADDARRVVVAAQEHARRLDHRQIGAEHLLLAAATDEHGSGARVLQALGVDAARLEADVAATGGIDDAALAALGIDVDEVRRRAEEAFGPGALERSAPRRRGLLRRGARPAHIPFTEGAKQGLERSLRESLALGDRRITSAHVVLGLLADPRADARWALRLQGVDPDAGELRALVARTRDVA